MHSRQKSAKAKALADCLAGHLADHPVGLLSFLALPLLLAACEPHADLQTRFIALGTEVSITLYDVDDDRAQAIVGHVERRLTERGRDWYPWADGELARINAALAAGESIDVSADLAKLLRRAAEIETASDNRFNAGLGELSVAWGLVGDGRNTVRAPDPGRIAELVAARPGARQLRWDGDRLLGSDTERPFVLDPGGIAKGFLLRESAAILAELPVDNFIINFGGDLLVHGQVHERAARIGIRAPGTRGAIATLDVDSGEAVITSGNYERFVEIDGQRYTHVIDPVTGYPVTGVVSVTVVDSDAALADAAATALMVGGSAEFDALCAALGIRYALLIPADGEPRLTDGMRQRVHWTDDRADKPLFE